jgi:hypothetical protein
MPEIKVVNKRLVIYSRGTNIYVTLKDNSGSFIEDFTMTTEQTITLIHSLIQILNQKYLKGEYIPPTHFGNVG